MGIVTVVVGADLQGLVSSHYQSCLLVFLVLQESHVTSTTLLPLSAITIELEELGAHLEGLFLSFLVGLGVNLLCEADNWFEMHVCFMFLDFLFVH